jgi:hypothetical protein
MTRAELARDAETVRAEYAEMVADQMWAAAWEAAEDEVRMTRAEADEDADRPWSRERWLEGGNGYY